MKHLLGFLFLLLGFASFGQIGTKISIPVTTYPLSRPALLNLPDDYATATTTRYAFLIFGHGAGERSNTGATDVTYQAGGYLNKIYNSSGAGGPAYFIENGGWPSSFTNPVDGLQYKFIVLSPQNDSWSIYSRDVKDIINWMVANYRVDSNRIYVTGLSAGGEETAIGYQSEYDIEAGTTLVPTRYKPAAGVPMSPALPGAVNPAWVATSVTDSVPNWGFGSPSNDPFGQYAKDFIDQQNVIKPNYSRFTTYGSGHCCWNTFYNPSYTEVIGGQTMNIYQWMLTKKRNATLPNTTGMFTFTLASSQRTSAAVFKISDSTLITTLWADSTFAAGTYTRYWDGKDDFGNTVTSPDANYRIQVLTNNVTYAWEGVIGNTSTAKTGASVHKGLYTSMTGMAITGTTAYYVQGYSEGFSSEAKFNTASPQVRLSVFPGKVSTMNSDYVATDGTTVYWAGYDAFSTSNSFVHATAVSNDAQISFGANGSSYTMFSVPYAKTYTSVIDKLNVTNSKPTGLAVGGTYLFVSHGGLNQLHVINKTTGALAQNLAITNVRGLAIEGSSLWMVSGTNTVAKYTINANGTLTAATLTLSGIATPGAIAVNGGNIAVIDAGVNQIVRFYNTTTGVQGTQLGTTGGYATSSDVTNTKFFFNDYRGNLNSFITYHPDGTFWLGDPGNYRELHFTAAKTYIEYIMSLGATYSTCVDPNNNTRVFGNYLEFTIDYSQPLATGWTLTKNWGYLYAPTNLLALTKMSNIVTLSNGRTYGFVTGGGYCEFLSSSLRVTGLNPAGVICKDGSSQRTTGKEDVGFTLTVTSYPLTGFDGSNNPLWSASGTLIATTPTNTLQNPNSTPQAEILTSRNKAVFYTTTRYFLGSTTQLQNGHHLGAIRKGTNTWQWKNQFADHIAYQGLFPEADYFEMGNGENDYAGSRVVVIDSFAFSGHHGEFWKNVQTNYYNQYLDNGMIIGQFGSDQFIHPGIADTGTAGNALTPTVVRNGANLYLYHGDESQHAGIHRWSITNLSSIAQQSITIPFPSTYTPPVLDYVDLHAGLPFNSTLATQNGWSKSGTVQYYTNRKKYINDGSPDVLALFSPPYTSTGTAIVQRDLGTNNVVNNWKISGLMSFDGSTIIANGSKIYIEVLDATGKVLARFYYTGNFSTGVTTIFGNTATIVSNTTTAYTDLTHSTPIEIKCVNGLVTFTYGSYTAVSTAIFDGTGNWKTPKTLRANVLFGSPQGGMQFDFWGMKLYTDYASIGAIYYISSTGDDTRTSAQAQNQATPWKTPAKVNSVFSTLNPGDQILFKAGEVFNGTLKINKSGGAGNPIIIGSYGTGAKPVLNGLTTLSGWVLISPGIYESPAISTLVPVSIVAINNKSYGMGRFPNLDNTADRGYLYFQSHNSNISITSSSVNSSTTNWTGAELVLRSKRFELDRYAITSHAGGTLSHAASGAVPTDNFGFFIQKDIRTLDQFGEWYYNPVTKKISIFTGGSAPTGYIIQVNTLDTGASIRNFDNITLDNLAFKGYGLRTIDNYTASNITIKNCDISLSGADAVFGAFTTNLNFSNNTITNSNSSAMDLTNACNSSTIQNNVIRNSGTIAGMGNNTSHAYSAIVLIDGVNNLIDHNTIDSTGFSPVRFFGNTNSVQYNYISNFGYILDDVGGVYIPLNGADSTAAVTQSGISITNNVISNGTGAAWGTNSPGTGSAHGIYFDNNVNNVVVDNNSVSNCFATGIYVHNDKNITVTNNTFFGNGIAFQTVHDVANQFNTRGLVINNNKFVGQLLTDKSANFKTILNDINLFGTINNNIYARPLDDNLTITTTVNSSTTTQRNLSAWQTFSGHDLASTKSPRAITDTNQIIYRSNPPNPTITLAGNWTDLKNVGYSGTPTLPSYTSLILIPAPITKTTPTITWSNPTPKIYPDPINAGDLNATGSVAGVITYNTTVGTIYNPGSYILTATLVPTDTSLYNIATKNVTLLVNFSTGQKVCINSNGGGGIYLFNHQNYNGTPLNLYPGDTLCINAGTYTFIQLNGLVGTAAKPIVIINNGQVYNTGSNGTSYCYLIQLSRFFKWTGTGTPGITYGFQAHWSGGYTGAMMNVRDSTTDYEIDHFEGWNVGNGFLCKIDPANNNPATWKGHWVIANVKIHDNYVHGSTGEVLYGITTDVSTPVDSSGTTITVLPVPGDNWEVYNNRFDTSGWDGIQLASCTDCLIHDNYVHNFGTLDISSQQAGIILGGRSNGKIYNNVVGVGTGNGIEYYGWGKDSSGVNVGKRVDIYNNTIDSVGRSVAQKQDGVYFDSRPAQSDSLKAYVINNTITRPGRHGVSTFGTVNNQSKLSKINNNLLVNPLTGNYITIQGGVIVDTTKNQRVSTIAGAGFVNYAIKNFAITGASSSFDFGLNAAPYGVTTDIIGTNRPQNLAYDAGAYESIPGAVKITPVITWTISNKVYGTAITAADLSPTSGGVAGTYSFTGISLGQIFSVGTYNPTLLFTPTDQATYNNATGSATFNVTPRPLTGVFSNTSKPFNNTPQQPTFTTSPVAGVAYSITFDGVGLIPTNVKIVSGVVTPYNTVAGITNPNYTMTPVNGTFTITPAPGTFTVLNLVYTYDSLLHNISVTTSNPAITYTITGAPQRYKGVYPVTVQNTNTNYSVPNVNTTLTINAGTTSLTSWNPANMTYNAAIGAAQTNAVFAKNGVSTYTPTTGFIPNAGTLPMRLDFVPSDTNLSPINNIIRNITVSKGTDVMTIQADTIQYFDGNPAFVTVTSLHGGTITVNYTGAHTAVGDYPFTATYFDANWQAVSVSGTLHILANSAIIKITNFANRVYTGSPIPPTVTSAYSYTLTFNGSATVPTNVGSYPNTIATINDGIHTGADTVTMTIIKATPTTTWPAISGGVFPYVVGAGILNASSPVAGTWAYSVNVSDTLSVGNNIISGTFTPTDLSNYNTVTITNTVVVTTGTAIINVGNLSQQYDGSIKYISTSTTPANLDSLIIVYTGNHQDAGSYPVNVQLSNLNYVATSVSTTLIISQGSYQLSWAMPAPIPSGSPLTALQYNPTSTIPGTFVFNYPLGTILPTGTIGLLGTFYPTDSLNYPIQTITTTISVYGNPFLDYFIRYGNVIYLNL